MIMTKLGLVLTGGGARAAFQVGVVHALQEILGTKSSSFEVITGNSAGAINASYLAANAENWAVATKNLSELWGRLRPEHVYDLRTHKLSDLGARWLGGTLFGGLTRRGAKINYLLDTTPLRKLINREIQFSDIQKNVNSGIVHGFSLATTNYNSGSNVIFYQGHPEIRDWARSDRFSYRTEINTEHVMASSAIPVFFPPVKLQESFFGDGCIRQTTPLSPAIHLGADKIIAIGVRYPHPQHRMQDLAFSPFPSPTLGQITGVMLNAIFLDSMEADVERLTRINRLIAAHEHPELKQIPILMIRPSKDLGKMTQMKSESLPPILRYLLRGIGVSNTEGLDLLSYLAFDESYTKPLMELGYEDAYRMESDILRFSDV
jgi:NTE family protein